MTPTPTTMTEADGNRDSGYLLPGVTLDMKLAAVKAYIARAGKCQPVAIVEALAAALAASPASAEQPERIGRDRDIILEAINTYEAWSEEDEFDARRVLDEILSRMKWRVKMTEAAAPPAPAPDDLRELREAAERASQGRWCQFHPQYCAEAKDAPRSSWDSSHDMSAVNGGERKRIATFKHADDAAFVDAANPSTVLSLIARITRLESENARLREALNNRPNIEPWGVVQIGNDGRPAIFSQKYNTVKARFTSGNHVGWKSGDIVYRAAVSEQKP